MTDAESLLSAPMEADGRRDTCVSTLVDAASSPCAWKANARKGSTVSTVCVLAREAQRARLNHSLHRSSRQSALCAQDERRHGEAHSLARTRAGEMRRGGSVASWTRLYVVRSARKRAV